MELKSSTVAVFEVIIFEQLRVLRQIIQNSGAELSQTNKVEDSQNIR
jgi:hypothetical protein